MIFETDTLDTRTKQVYPDWLVLYRYWLILFTHVYPQFKQNIQIGKKHFEKWLCTGTRFWTSCLSLYIKRLCYKNGCTVCSVYVYLCTVITHSKQIFLFENKGSTFPLPHFKTEGEKPNNIEFNSTSSKYKEETVTISTLRYMWTMQTTYHTWFSILQMIRYYMKVYLHKIYMSFHVHWLVLSIPSTNIYMMGPLPKKNYWREKWIAMVATNYTCNYVSV